MTNDEFQIIVLSKLDSIDERLDGRIDRLEERFNNLEVEVREVGRKVDSVIEQTAVLTEFKSDTDQRLSDIKDTLQFISFKQVEQEKDIFHLKKRIAQ